MLLHSVQGPRYGGARAPPPIIWKSILKRNRKKPTKGKAPEKKLFFPAKCETTYFIYIKARLSKRN